jgi:excisionase family DNA binding protein
LSSTDTTRVTTSGVNRTVTARDVEAAQHFNVGAYRNPGDAVKTSAEHDRATTAMAYGVNDAAALLGVSRWTLYELLRRGEIRSFKVAGRRLVSAQAIVDFIADAESEGYATFEIDGL